MTATPELTIHPGEGNSENTPPNAGQTSDHSDCTSSVSHHLISQTPTVDSLQQEAAPSEPSPNHAKQITANSVCFSQRAHHDNNTIMSGTAPEHTDDQHACCSCKPNLVTEIVHELEELRKRRDKRVMLKIRQLEQAYIIKCYEKNVAKRVAMAESNRANALYHGDAGHEFVFQDTIHDLLEPLSDLEPNLGEDIEELLRSDYAEFEAIMEKVRNALGGP